LPKRITFNIRHSSSPKAIIIIIIIAMNLKERLGSKKAVWAVFTEPDEGL
jgi:hypothetical protein